MLKILKITTRYCLSIPWMQVGISLLELLWDAYWRLDTGHWVLLLTSSLILYWKLTSLCLRRNWTRKPSQSVHLFLSNHDLNHVNVPCVKRLGVVANIWLLLKSLPNRHSPTLSKNSSALLSLAQLRERFHFWTYSKTFRLHTPILLSITVKWVEKFKELVRLS